MGLRRIFAYLDEIPKIEIFRLIDRNNELARGMGDGLGHSFTSLTTALQQEILERAKLDSDFTRGLADGLAHSIKYLDKELQAQIMTVANKNPYLSEKVGIR